MSENVRSIERAIEVMRELQTLESASLAQLQARTGLPKAYRTTPGPCRGCSASDGKPTSFGHLAI